MFNRSQRPSSLCPSPIPDSGPWKGQQRSLLAGPFCVRPRDKHRLRAAQAWEQRGEKLRRPGLYPQCLGLTAKKSTLPLTGLCEAQPGAGAANGRERAASSQPSGSVGLWKTGPLRGRTVPTSVHLLVIRPFPTLTPSSQMVIVLASDSVGPRLLPFIPVTAGSVGTSGRPGQGDWAPGA